jgi:hypothetical protein
MCVLHILCIIGFYNCYDNYLYYRPTIYSYFCNYDLLLCFRMVEVCWISNGIRASLQETYPECCSYPECPGQTSRGTCQRLELFCTTCATPFRALPGTAGRAQAMDAGCGSLTHGHWDGPVTCNKSHGSAALEAKWRKVPCEDVASPGLGHATVCSRCSLTTLLGSLGSASAR